MRGQYEMAIGGVSDQLHGGLTAAPDASPGAIINFINCIEVAQGEHLGEPVELMGWQRRLIRGLYADDTRTAALTVSRGNGKTSLAAWIASAYLLPGAPLHRRNGQVVVVASSIEQGRLLLQKVVDVLPDGHNGQVWQLWNSAGACRVTHKSSGANLKVFGSKASTIHGVEPILSICDEGSMWEKGNRVEVANAIMTSAGKVPGSRALWIGTAPESSDNPFSKLLDGQADYVQRHEYTGKNFFTLKSIRRANPSLDHFPELRLAIERERALARIDPAALASFKAYRLNQGTPENQKQANLLEPDQLAAIEVDQVEVDPEYVLGLDLSSGWAQSACAAISVSPDERGVHDVDCFAAWPSIPSLKDRGQQDRVKDYEAMHEQGDLVLHEGRTVDVKQLIVEAFDRWGRPETIVGDRYRHNELKDALEPLGYFEGHNLILRGMGYQDGGEDVRGFQRMAVGRSLALRKSLLLRRAFSACRTVSDPAGNVKVAKENERSQTGRDDAAVAVVVAAGEVSRYTAGANTAGYTQVVSTAAW